LIPSEGDFVLLNLLVDGVVDSFGAHFLLLSQSLFLWGLVLSERPCINGFREGMTDMAEVGGILGEEEM